MHIFVASSLKYGSMQNNLYSSFDCGQTTGKKPFELIMSKL